MMWCIYKFHNFFIKKKNKTILTPFEDHRQFTFKSTADK